jgi:hypothetical protein
VSQVNLLPQEILSGQRVRRTTAIVAVAGVVAAVLIGAFYLLQSQRLSNINSQIASQDAANAAVQQQIAVLQQYAQLETQAQSQQALLHEAYKGEVSFAELLMDVSRIIPDDSYLSSLGFQLTAPSTSGTTSTTPAFVGSMTASGKAATLESVTTWLKRIESVNGWVNPWTTGVTYSDTEHSYSFSSTADLTDAVVTPRGKAAS